MSLSEFVHLGFIPWNLACAMTMYDCDSEFSGCSWAWPEPKYLHSFSPMGWGEIRRKAKALICWVRGGAKAVCTRKAKKRFIHCFPLASSATCWTADVMAAWKVEDKGHKHEYCCFLLFSLSFYCTLQHSVVQSFAVVNAHHCPSCLLCQLLAQGRVRWQPEEQSKPWPCTNTVWQQSKESAVEAVLVTNPKHNTLRTAVKKTNSVPDRRSTISTFCSASFPSCSGPPLSNTYSSPTTPFPILFSVFLNPFLTLWTTLLKCP